MRQRFEHYLEKREYFSEHRMDGLFLLLEAANAIEYPACSSLDNTESRHVSSEIPQVSAVQHRSTSLTESPAFDKIAADQLQVDSSSSSTAVLSAEMESSEDAFSHAGKESKLARDSSSAGTDNAAKKEESSRQRSNRLKVERLSIGGPTSREPITGTTESSLYPKPLNTAPGVVRNKPAAEQFLLDITNRSGSSFLQRSGLANLSNASQGHNQTSASFRIHSNKRCYTRLYSGMPVPVMSLSWDGEKTKVIMNNSIRPESVSIERNKDAVLEDALEPSSCDNASDHTTSERRRMCVQVEILRIISPGEFYVTLSKNSYSIERMHNEVQAKIKDEAVKQTRWKEGEMCVVFPTVATKQISCYWYRARIIKAIDDSNYTVFMIDKAYTMNMHYMSIRRIPHELRHFQPAAIRCFLACVGPTDNQEKWNHLVIDAFKLAITKFQSFSISLHGRSQNDTLPVILWGMTAEHAQALYPRVCQYTNVNNNLVQHGYVHLREKFQPLSEAIPVEEELARLHEFIKRFMLDLDMNLDEPVAAAVAEEPSFADSCEHFQGDITSGSMSFVEPSFRSDLVTSTPIKKTRNTKQVWIDGGIEDRKEIASPLNSESLRKTQKKNRIADVTMCPDSIANSWFHSEKLQEKEGSMKLINDFTLDEYFHRVTAHFDDRDIYLCSSDEEDDAPEGVQSGAPSVIAEFSSPFGKGIPNETMTEKVKTGNRRIINRDRKEKGLSYTRRDGTRHPARRIKRPCQCKKRKCFEKFSYETRCKILQHLLGLKRSGQNQFLALHMKVFPSIRHRVLDSNRVFSRKYYLPGLRQKVRVCKVMYLRTFDITDRKVRTLAKKFLENEGLVTEDGRLKNVSYKKLTEEQIDIIKAHISSFPLYSSHYSREKSSKLYLSGDLTVTAMHKLYEKKCIDDNWTPIHRTTYTKIFRTMGLGFKPPSLDTCCKCDELDIAITQASGSKKASLEAVRLKHQDAAANVYKHMKKDRALATDDASLYTLSFDLQKQLPTPHLTCGQAFYSRQLYVYNLTVFATRGGNASYCYLWDETIGRRGSQEIASCLIKHLEQIDDSVEVINMYSDRCAGQNRNKFLVYTLCHFIERCRKNGRSLRINHIYMVSGHSHMAVDTIHAAIERQKKKLKVNIEVPEDWGIMIGAIQRETSIEVKQMRLSDLLAYATLQQRYSFPKKDSSNETVKFNDIMVFAYDTNDPGSVQIKCDIMEPEFKTIHLLKPDQLDDPNEIVISPINNDYIKLNDAKAEDLRKLLKFIGKVEYYNNLLQRVAPKPRGQKRKSKKEEHIENFDGDLDPIDSDLEEEILEENMTVEYLEDTFM